MKKMSLSILVAIMFLISLSGCRNETQNLIRRQIQDFTGQNQYIVLYSANGETLFQGQVDGKVTRSSADGSAGSNGSYIFWYDKQGVYFQSDLPYLVTSKPLSEVVTISSPNTSE